MGGPMLAGLNEPAASLFPRRFSFVKIGFVLIAK
jgi:hypothetical protein